LNFKKEYFSKRLTVGEEAGSDPPDRRAILVPHVIIANPYPLEKVHPKLTTAKNTRFAARINAIP